MARRLLNASLSRCVDACWSDLAAECDRQRPDWSSERCETAARKTLEAAAFLQLCRQAKLPRADLPADSIDAASRLLGPALAPRDPDLLDGGPLAHAGAALEFLQGGPDVLGEIHLRLLGRRRTRSSDGRTRLVRDASPRRAGGVFYTPPFVARYIAAEIQPGFKIVDPACGCGVFLLAAYRRMLANDRRRDHPTRRRALLRRIHGVDLDGEAVLAARRALWLEMNAGHGLPLDGHFLAETICSGDALVGPVLEAHVGTFDFVLGNPPYRRELGTRQLLEQIAQTDFGRRWRAARMDLWYYFAHRGLELLAPGGSLAFIVNAYWTHGRGAEKLIDQLRRETRVDEVFDLDRLPVFSGVSGRHMIFRATKTNTAGPTTIKRAAAGYPADAESLLGGHAMMCFQKSAEELFYEGRLDLEPPEEGRLEELPRTASLGQLGKIRQGIVENPAAVDRRTNRRFEERWTPGEGVFLLSPAEAAALDLPDAARSLLRPYHDLCDLGRYRIASTPSRVLIYSTSETCPDIEAHPELRAHLERFRPIMEARRETRRGVRAWWHLHWPREASLWESPKIISVQMASRPAFAPSLGPAWTPFSTNVFVPSPDRREHLFYFAAVLNSRLLWRWYQRRAKRRGVGLEINGRVLASTPIRTIDFADAADRRRHDRLVELVEQMMRQPKDALDRQIDALVEELYGLAARPEQD